jgi:hypothetical protein
MATLSAKASFAPESETTTNFQFEKKIDQLTNGATQYFRTILLKMANANPQNVQTLCEFISAETSERNLKLSSRLTKIKILCLFNRQLNYKQFERITKNDIRNYLDSLKKPESQDPTHEWIGTYNTRQMVICKFFKWLYNCKCVQGKNPLRKQQEVAREWDKQYFATSIDL